MTKYSHALGALSARASSALVASLLLGQVALLLFAEVALTQHVPHPLKLDVIPGIKQVKHLLAHQKPEADPAAAAQLEANGTAPERKVPKLVTLDASARIFLMENFLSEEECDHIIELAKPGLLRSGVVDTMTGGTTLDDIRTSSGTFLERGSDPIIADIEERIAHWTLLPVENGEALQVLRYLPTQRYGGHYDYFFDEENTKNGKNRYATVLMYLNDVPEGGETTFPNIPAPGGDNGPEYSECARHVLAAKPKKGSAVLFHSIDLEGNLETRSFHEACPVIKGEKWSAPKWIHQREHRRTRGGAGYAWEAERSQNKMPAAAAECVDRNESCQAWALAGECEKNPAFMLGTQMHPGECLQSCKKCGTAEVKSEL